MIHSCVELVQTANWQATMQGFVSDTESETESETPTVKMMKRLETTEILLPPPHWLYQ